MNPAAPMLEIAQLSKIYPNTSQGSQGGLKAARFSLPAGTFFTLLGPSGCGKTTTLRCIAGLEEPDTGKIVVDGQTFFDDARRISIPMNRRNIGMVFQSYAIWPHMSVFDNIAFPLKVSKDIAYTRKEIESLVHAALETVSLSGYAGRSATMLSGGQQQRVALARAIVRRPRLLLLDEPLSNLDASLRDELRDELRKLQQQIGVTTVYVTHDQTEALELSDSIAVMDRGEIVQLGSPRQIWFEPANRFVARFVGSTNWLEGSVEKLEAGRAHIRTSSGQRLVCEPRVELARNQPVAISVRPESVKITSACPASLADHNHVEGRVSFVSFAGTMTRVQVDVGGDRVQLYDRPTATHKPGDTLALSFPIAETVAFAGV
ncbi:ABC transporter ATP-binding protein [Caballeronia sp. LZ035]|uniref:ABC transporter ATP-binding protein n=1 Tax=Caballeronia sp. LZ035 TaxID=3038568 RepID=UPI0028662962|nr:ABC transporter ATP-binding protein [Caballeronia sp. LZ035]MDR5759083.1 ABC transporter ATP-binding protein [Caballeronia sp. LZ035]